MGGHESTMVVFLCLVAQLVVLAPSQTAAVDASVTWDEDRIVDEPESHRTRTIFLEANLTVKSNLTLENVELVILGTCNGSRSIEVVAGGCLSLIAGTRVRSSDPSVHYTLIARQGARFVMNDSRMSDCGWDDIANDTVNQPCYRGLYIATSVAWITNSSLRLNGVGLVVDAGSSPEISRCNISENEGDGIRVLNGSSPKISDNTLCGNAASYPDWACDLTNIYSDGSSPDISNNTMSAKAPGLGARPLSGIHLNSGGSPVVRGNTILDHDGYGTYRGIYITGAHASISNNTLVGNLDGLVLESEGSQVVGNTIDRGLMRSTMTSCGVQDGSRSTFRDNVMRGFTYGLYLNDMSNSTFSNETISNNEAGVDGHSWMMPYDVVLDRCRFSQNDMDVTLTDWHGGANGGTVTLVDPVYSPSKASVTGAGSKLIVKWRCDAQVLFENLTRAAASARVEFTDARGAMAASGTTGPDGRMGTLVLTEYTRTSNGREGKSPYTVQASRERWCNRTEGVVLDRSLELTVFLDDIEPWVKIASPRDGFLTNEAEIEVSGTCEPGATVAVNGETARVSQGGSWSVMVALSEGPNTISAKAVDRSGNTASASMKVELDSVPPPLEVSSPRDGTLTNDSHLKVSGTARDLTADLTLNGVGVDRAADGSFTRTMELIEGENLLVFECRDPAGNTASEARKVFVDTKAPMLAIQGPRDGTITSRGTVTVIGRAERGSTVALNGFPVATEEGSFSRPVELVEGANRMVITCKDEAGNEASVALVVTRDSVPPVISMMSPVDGAVVNAIAVTVRGSTEPGVSVKVNGENVVLNGKEFSALVILSSEGPNGILVEAVDAAGNLAEKSVTVELDSMPPTLKMMAPGDDFLTNQTTVEIEGKTEPGASVSLGSASVTADGRGHFKITAELPVEGLNVLTLVASDRAGNSDDTEVAVTRDTMLHYSITSPVSGAVVGDKVVTIVGDVEPGATVTIDGKTVQPCADGSFSSEVTLKDGLNNITITVSDRAGNREAAVLEITRNAPGPSPARPIPNIEGALLALLLGIAVLLHRSGRAAADRCAGRGQRAGDGRRSVPPDRPPVPTSPIPRKRHVKNRTAFPSGRPRRSS